MTNEQEGNSRAGRVRVKRILICLPAADHEELIRRAAEARDNRFGAASVSGQIRIAIRKTRAPAGAGSPGENVSAGQDFIGETLVQGERVRVFITMTRGELEEWRRRGARAKDRGATRLEGSVSGQIATALVESRQARAEAAKLVEAIAQMEVKAEELAALQREVREAMHAVGLIIVMLEGGSCSVEEAVKWLREARALVG